MVLVNGLYFNISKTLLKNKTFLKIYNISPKFVNKIVENEISINRILQNNGFKYSVNILGVKNIRNKKILVFNRLSVLKIFNTHKKFFVFEELLLIVKSLHNLGIVHNDINIGNILLSKNKKVYLIDYQYASVSNKVDKDIFSLIKIINRWFGINIKKEIKNIDELIYYWRTRYGFILKRRIKNQKQR